MLSMVHAGQAHAFETSTCLSRDRGAQVKSRTDSRQLVGRWVLKDGQVEASDVLGSLLCERQGVSSSHFFLS